MHDEHGKVQIGDGQHGAAGGGPGGKPRLFIHTGHGAEHLAQDAEGIKDHEQADKEGGVGHEVRGCTQKAGELGRKDRKQHGNRHNKVSAEPEALAERPGCALLVAVAQPHTGQGGNAEAQGAAQGKVQGFDAHDDADDGQTVGPQAVAHDDAFQDDHDDLGGHADQGDQAIL